MKYVPLKGIKQMKNHVIILLKSWISTPFKTQMYFSLEIIWTIFAPKQDSPIDPVLTGDNYELSRIINI